MGGGTGPRNVLFTTGQECKVSFSKVLQCVSGPNTVVTDVAWVAGRVPGRGRCSSGALQDCGQFLVTVGHGAQAPAPPQTLPSHQCLAGYWVLQGRLGCRKRLECSLAPSLHLARAGMWVCPLSRAAPPQQLRLHHEAGPVVLALLSGTDDNLRQLTGREVPVRRLSVHSLPTVTAQATLVPSKFCSRCSVSPQYLPIHWRCQLGATSWGRRTLHPGLGPSGMRQPW